MKKTAIILFCLILMFPVSCTQSRDKRGANRDNGIAETEAVSEAKVITETEPEVFEEFLDKFNRTRSFQLRRIKFPINVIVPDVGDEGMAPIQETVGKYEWELLDLSYDSTYLTRTYDQYYQEVHYKNDTAVVELRGINNGIYADYYFKLIDNKWYLVTLYEASF